MKLKLPDVMNGRVCMPEIDLTSQRFRQETQSSREDEKDYADLVVLIPVNIQSPQSRAIIQGRLNDY